MIQFINTSGLGPFISKSVALEQQYFGPQAFNEEQVRYWYSARRFFYAGAYDITTDKIRSSMSVLLIDEDNYRKLQNGAHENELIPYQIASRKIGYLYLGGLIIGNRHDTPYLYHKITKDIVKCAQTEDIPIRFAFSVPTSPVVERLLKRYGFAQDGLYRNQYPIFTSSIVGPRMWQAFLQGAEHGEPFARDLRDQYV